MKNRRGFTLIELIVATSIIITLLGFITISLVGSQRKASLVSIGDMLLTDLRQQQLKAMIGDTEGRGTSDSYGIHFDSNQYVLFNGAYSVGEASNSVITLDSNIQFNSSDFDVVFSKLSGETSSDTIVELQDNTNSSLKRIHLNALGTVIQVESL